MEVTASVDAALVARAAYRTARVEGRVEVGDVWHSAVEVLGNARRSVWTEASPVDIISTGSVSASI